MKQIPTCTHTGLLALTGFTSAQECIRACMLAALCVWDPMRLKKSGWWAFMVQQFAMFVEL